MDTIQVRVPSKTKKAAQKVFAELGIDMSSGVNLYLTQVVKTKGIPFQPRTVNGLTPSHEARIIRETEYAKKHGPFYNSVEEMWADLK
jgi:DNA-damage-inducible protein J